MDMVRRAKTLASMERLGEGKSFFKTTMKDIAELGTGIHLYFMFTKYMGVLFFLMSLLSIPSFILNVYGNGITTQIADPMGLSYLSIANQGLNDDFNTTKYCLPNGTIDCTLQTLSNPITTDPYKASYVMTMCDICYSLVFGIFIWFFQMKSKSTIASHNTENLTPAKYAIYVRGLPKDAKKEEILGHFNGLYDLTLPQHEYPMRLGCFGRQRPAKKQQIVSSCTFNCDLKIL